MNSQWRGFNICGCAHPQDLANIIQSGVDQYKANVFRVQISDSWDNVNQWNATQYQNWFSQRLQALQVGADTAAALKVRLIPEIHHAVGGRPHGKDLIFTKSWARHEFIEHWAQLASQFKDHPGILGYDLMNEPAIRRTSKLMATLLPAAKRIRAIDSKPRIIFSPRYGDPTRVNSLGSYMREIKRLKRVWITAHMYWPHNVTHQGVPDANCSIRYPIGAKLYPTAKVNKSKLINKLQMLRDFQRRYRVKIFIGEYSCIRWSGYPTANNALPYLRDLMQIFEDYNWRYAYHAYSNTGPWDLEFTNTPCPDPCQIHCHDPAPGITDRSWLIKDFFAQNVSA